MHGFHTGTSPFMRRFDKEMFTKRNKAKEMNVVGDGDQDREACWDFTPLQFNLKHRQVTHAVTRGLIKVTVCVYVSVWCDCVMHACLLVPFQRATSSNTAAAHRLNHLPFLEMDISARAAGKCRVAVGVPCRALPTGTQVWASEWVLIASGRTAEGNIVQERE